MNFNSKDMKKLNTYIIVFVLTGLCSGSMIFGQAERVRERINAQRIAFFTEKIELTSEEAKLFWPVYDDYSNRRERLKSEERNQKTFLMNNSDNMSDSEIEKSLNEFISIRNKEHNLFIEYHNKFLEILSPAKVMKLYIAEDQFKQFLLQKLRERQDPRRRRP